MLHRRFLEVFFLLVATTLSFQQGENETTEKASSTSASTSSSAPSSTTTSAPPTRAPETASTSSGGEVAFIVGNLRHSEDVEVYSPDGKCQHALAKVPFAFLPSPILFLHDEKIYACADTVYTYTDSETSCWNYDPIRNEWQRFDANIDPQSFKRFSKSATVYNNTLFIVDEYNPEAYDIVDKKWGHWPLPINGTSAGACLVNSGGSLILIGGSRQSRVVQGYDVEKGSWKTLASAPYDVEFAGCVEMPNKKILVLGSSYSEYRHSAAVYDPVNDSWEVLGKTLYDRYGTSLLTLGSRVFAIGGGRDRNVLTEEYDYKNNLWIVKYADLQLHRIKHRTLAVPAKWFQHLPGGCEGVL